MIVDHWYLKMKSEPLIWFVTNTYRGITIDHFGRNKRLHWS